MWYLRRKPYAMFSCFSLYLLHATSSCLSLCLHGLAPRYIVMVFCTCTDPRYVVMPFLPLIPRYIIMSFLVLAQTCAIPISHVFLVRWYTGWTLQKPHACTKQFLGNRTTLFLNHCRVQASKCPKPSYINGSTSSQRPCSLCPTIAFARLCPN